MATTLETGQQKKVTFIQYDIPPLKAGEYTLQVTQKVNQEEGSFSTSKQFAVKGERFTFKPEDYHSVFPQNHANGEFSEVLPHVVFKKRILPWNRTSVPEEESAPWLAVFLFNEDEVPTIQKKTAKDLVPNSTPITVAGSAVKGTGTMPAGYYSYPCFDKLDYGESPDDPCNAIDISAALFNKIAPTATELPYLAHIRETTTVDKEDQQALSDQSYAVVLSNRLSKTNTTSYAFLVSLENMGPNLPAEDGSSQLPSDVQHVRLLCYKSWRFIANDLDQSFKSLLENLNKDAQGNLGLTTLQFPSGPAPSQEAVQEALSRQATGTMTDGDGQVLVKNALSMGYLPLDHHLRHAGHTVSWYRGPLLPYYVTEVLDKTLPISGPDAANRYNPDTGLFDVAYGAAWQLGQLLALQNNSFATALYNWKRTQTAQAVAAEEQQIIHNKLQGVTAFREIWGTRQARLATAQDDIPQVVTQWLSQLSLLKGVPFSYLVPHEAMLPTESMRFFYLDLNWIDSLLDGAFSLGRATTGEDDQLAPKKALLMQAAKSQAKKARPQKAELVNYANTSGKYTGFLLRSAVVGGWPSLEVNGYADTQGNTEIPKLRMERLSKEVLLCLFDGEIQMAALHEPPEALHAGVEGTPPSFTTTLREIVGGNPGQQLIGHTASIPVRADQQTLQVTQGAQSILTAIQGLGEKVDKITSAEFGLEMVKGVVKVEFQAKTQ